MFVFNRSRDTKRLGEYGEFSIWSGQHVEATASGGSVEPVDLCAAKESLARRIKANLHLKVEFPTEPLGMVWVEDGQSPRSKQHLGVFFAVRINDENVAQSLEDKEFKTHGRGHPITSQFSSLGELSSGGLELESWSDLVVYSGWLKQAEATT